MNVELKSQKKWMGKKMNAHTVGWEKGGARPGRNLGLGRQFGPLHGRSLLASLIWAVQIDLTAQILRSRL